MNPIEILRHFVRNADSSARSLARIVEQLGELNERVGAIIVMQRDQCESIDGLAAAIKSASKPESPPTSQTSQSTEAPPLRGEPRERR